MKLYIFIFYQTLNSNLKLNYTFCVNLNIKTIFKLACTVWSIFNTFNICYWSSLSVTIISTEVRCYIYNLKFAELYISWSLICHILLTQYMKYRVNLAKISTSFLIDFHISKSRETEKVIIDMLSGCCRLYIEQ